MTASVANYLPARYFLRCPKIWKLLGPTVTSGPVNGYGAAAGRWGTTRPTVPISRPLISISTNFFYAVLQTFVPWWDICLNVHGYYMESDAHNPLPLCHVCIKARIKFWASESLLPYFKKLIYNVTSTYVNKKLILQEVWLWIISCQCMLKGSNIWAP
jgi:hypothetical protein